MTNDEKQMNVTHEYNGIGFVFKPTKQQNYTHEENMAYIQQFLKEVHHAQSRCTKIHQGK